LSAIVQLHKSCDKSPTNDNALIMIARIHLQMGQKAEALSALRQAVELNPD
jgi:cytochrome c-type biogenesis protein CcmH/NrfG